MPDSKQSLMRQPNGPEIIAWRKRRATIIQKYGTADAATAPCEREKLLLAAVEPWRTKSEEWTLKVDGWRGSGSDYQEMPARARQAIIEAIPLPTAFSEAKVETDYWTARNAELRDVLSEDGTCADDVALDLVAEVRAAIVSDLALHELRVTNIIDLHERLMMYCAAGGDDPRVEGALCRDIAAMAASAQSQPFTARTDAPSDTAARISAALEGDPSRSDRDIARLLRCSPTTVGRVRAALGLRSSTRAVSRGDQQFKMHVAAAQTS